MKLYRVMKVDTDGKPRVGTRGYMLGVRSSGGTGRADVDAIADTDPVNPGEGLSTSDDPDVLTIGRNEALFELDTDDLAPDLIANPDHPPHCLIEPRHSMTLLEFQQLLADTRDSWQRIP